jgi:hypothetical protein
MICEPVERATLEKVRKLVRHLRRSNPVRQIALSLLEDVPEEVGTIQPLLDVLSKPSEARWRELAVAAWALGRAPVNDVQKEQAAQLLCRVASNQQMGVGRRLLKRSARAIFRTALFSLLPIGVSLLLTYMRRYENPEGLMPSVPFLYLLLAFWGQCLLGLMLPIASILFDYDHNVTVRKFAIQSLGPMGRLSSIGTLAELSLLSTEAYCSLKEVLSHLTYEDYPLHSAVTPNLCRLLKHPYEVGRLAILEALEKIGNGRAVQPVERLMNQGESLRVREEAARILPALQERQRRENDLNRLVRAADAPGASDTLLRPATDSGMSDPKALLRAVLSGVTSGEADQEP